MKRTPYPKNRCGAYLLRCIALSLSFQSLSACVSLPAAVEAELSPAKPGEANHFDPKAAKRANKSVGSDE